MDGSSADDQLGGTDEQQQAQRGTAYVRHHRTGVVGIPFVAGSRCDGVADMVRLVDDITYQNAVESGNAATASAILGPFWRETPVRPNGSSISSNTPADASPVFMHGKVTDATTGKPIANATVDLWQAST